MSDFRGNIDHWLKQSEPDYYLFFLKAWIPFNAWYVAELPHLMRNDTKIIKELLDNANSKPRKIIEGYLSRDDYDSQTFKSHLAELHYNLERQSLSHNGHKVSFKSISLTANPKVFDKFIDASDNVFKVEKKPTYFQAFIEAKGGKVLLDVKQSTYIYDDLEKDTNFIRLPDPKVQSKIKELYKEIDPDRPTSLVILPSSKQPCTILKSKNTCKFMDDHVTIAKGCIKVLYSLRCMLFHGEVEPINANRPIYEHGFYLLRLIIKELN